MVKLYDTTCTEVIVVVKKQLSIVKLREDPIYFATELLNIKLHEGQKRILKAGANSRFIVVRASRRFGKSFIFSVFAIHASYTNPNYRVVLVSKSQRQSLEMFNTIYGILMGSKISSSITRNTLTMLEFANGSKIESLPGGNPDSLRGLTLNLVLCDESAFIPDALFQAVSPTIMSTLGSMILISTPNLSSGEFYRACQEDSIYTRFHLTHDDAYFIGEDGKKIPFIDPEELEREKWNCGGEDSPRYKREILAEFTDSEGGFFDLDAVNDSLKPDLPQIHFAVPGHKYCMGCDLAIKQDYTVLVILDYTDRNNLKVVRYRRFNGKSTDQIMLEVYKEASMFKITNALIDTAGIGVSLLEHLKSNYPGYRWEGFTFTTTSKVPLMSDLNIAMCNRMIEIPDDDIIREELISFYYEENPNTKHIKLGGYGCHDDIPIALALALRASGIFGNRTSPTLIGSDRGFLKPNNEIGQGHVFL